MESIRIRVENGIRLWAWRAARICGRNRLVSPIQWRKGAKVEIPSTLIASSSKENKERLERIRMEVELYSRLSDYFPSSPLREQSWRSLLACNSLKERIDLIKFIRLKELEKEKDRERKEKRKMEKEYGATVGVQDENTREDEGKHRFTLVSLQESRERYSRVSSSIRVNRLSCTPQLVVDCRFLPQLSHRGANLTAQQIAYLISENRDRVDPWPLTLASFDETNEVVKGLKKRHLTMVDNPRDATPTISPLPISSLFPPQKIVYLSPHAEEELTTINEDEVYVIGGIVDRVIERGIPSDASFVAAQSEGVRTMKFPLERYVKWHSGTKYLTLVAVMRIVQQLYEEDNDWDKVLRRNIPVRNTRPSNEKNSMIKEHHQRIRQFDRRVRELIEEKMNRLY